MYYGPRHTTLAVDGDSVRPDKGLYEGCGENKYNISCIAQNVWRMEFVVAWLQKPSFRGAGGGGKRMHPTGQRLHVDETGQRI